MTRMNYKSSVLVACDCNRLCQWDGCDGTTPRNIDQLRPTDVLTDKEGRARVAAVRAFTDRGHDTSELTESSMPVRLMDGPLNWGYHRSLPAVDDSFAGVVLRVPHPGRDASTSTLERCEYAVYACVSDAPVRRAWRFHFIGFDLSDVDTIALLEEANR